MIRNIPTMMLVSAFCALIIIITAPQGYTETVPEEAPSPKSIDQAIEERDAIIYDPNKKSLFPDTHYKIRDKLNEWQRKIGLEVSLAYDAVTQGYLDTSQSLFGTAGDLTLSGKWLLLGTKYLKPFYLSFRVRNRHSFNNSPPSDFRSETGLFWGTVDGFNDSGTQIPNLYLSQELQKSGITFHYGQFSIDNFFDSHSMRSAKRFFLNQAFSANPTINFPRYGMGAIVQWQPTEKINFTIGASNIQGTDQGKEIDLSFNSNALFESIQASYFFEGMGNKNARIQVMAWNSDANREDEFSAGNGISITLEHNGPNKGESYIFRYANADGDSTLTESLLFFAYGKDFKNYNHFGIGLGTGESSDSDDWQTIFEMFYKIQLTKELILTPDLQLIVGNGVADNNDIRMVAGLRLGFTF